MSRRSASLLYVLALLGTSIAAVARPAASAVQPQMSVSQRVLSTGAVLATVTSGSEIIGRVVADQGTRVRVHELPGRNSNHKAMAFELIPPEVRSQHEAAIAAARYAAAGRSPESDLEVLSILDTEMPPPDEDIASCHDLPDPASCSGVAAIWRDTAGQPDSGGTETVEPLAEADPLMGPTSTVVGEFWVGSPAEPLAANEDYTAAAGGSLWASGCAEVRNAPNGVKWRGCYRRYTVRESDRYNWYSADESQAAGDGSFWWALTQGRTDHRYNRTVQIVMWQPGAEVSSGRCHDRTFSVSAYGTSVSETVRVCPERIVPAISSNQFYTDWEGHSHGRVVATAAVNMAKVGNGQFMGFRYYVGAWWCFC